MTKSPPTIPNDDYIHRLCGIANQHSRHEEGSELEFGHLWLGGVLSILFRPESFHEIVVILQSGKMVWIIRFHEMLPKPLTNQDVDLEPRGIKIRGDCRKVEILVRNIVMIY